MVAEFQTIDSSRLRSTPKPPPKTWRGCSIIEPKRIATSGAHWVAVRTAIGCEQRVAEELTTLAYRAYCPLAAKFVFWQDGKRSKHKLIKQYPVFARYIFVGLGAGQFIGKGVVDIRESRVYTDPQTGAEKFIQAGKRWLAAEKIEAVLSDSMGPVRIPEAAIRQINDLEMGRHWDETQSWRDKLPYQLGSTLRVLKGAFASFSSTMDARISEDRIRVLVDVFGRSTVVELDIADVETV